MTTPAVDPSFGPFLFSDGNVTCESFTTALRSAVEISQSANANRGVSSEGKKIGRLIHMECTVQGTSWTNLNANISAFLAALGNGKKDLHFLSDRFFLCQQVGDAIVIPGTGADVVGKVSLDMWADDPFTISNYATYSRVSISGTSFAFSLPTTGAVGGNCPEIPCEVILTVGSTSIVANDVITISNTTTAPYAILRWKSTTTYTTGEQLRFDAENGDVYVNGTLEYHNLSGPLITLQGGVQNSFAYSGPNLVGATIDFIWSERSS